MALFVAGLLAFRERDAVTGTAFSALGALWFTWAVTAGSRMSDNAAGLFLLLFALVALSLTLGAAGGVARPGHLRPARPCRSCCWPSRTFARQRRARQGSAAGSRVAAGAVAWYAATAALAHWPTAFPDALPAGG